MSRLKNWLQFIQRWFVRHRSGTEGKNTACPSKHGQLFCLHTLETTSSLEYSKKTSIFTSFQTEI